MYLHFNILICSSLQTQKKSKWFLSSDTTTPPCGVCECTFCVYIHYEAVHYSRDKEQHVRPLRHCSLWTRDTLCPTITRLQLGQAREPDWGCLWFSCRPCFVVFFRYGGAEETTASQSCQEQPQNVKPQSERRRRALCGRFYYFHHHEKLLVS